MKKAKIMLMVIAIFGVIGGALAFKATKFFGGPNGICYVSASSTYCLSQYTTIGAARVVTNLFRITTTTDVPIFFCKNTFGLVPYYCTGFITTYAVPNVGE